MTGLTGRLTRAALAISFVAGSAASAAEPVAGPCLQQSEAEDLMVFMLPSLMEAMARKCTPLLPASATLSRSGQTLASRYRADSLAAWPNARAAFTKASGGEPIQYLSEDLTRKVIEEASSAAVVANFKAKDCAIVDRFIGALAPLPARNIAQLMSLLMEIGANKNRSPMQICPVGAAR
jgi:hypothetical protein